MNSVVVFDAGRPIQYEAQGFNRPEDFMGYFEEAPGV